MALIQCSECFHDVSDRAQFCPKCGNDINEFLSPGAQASLNRRPEHSYLLADRKIHLLGIAAFTGTGVLTMANERMLSNTVGFLGLGIAIYLLVVMSRQLLALKDASPAESSERIFELLEIITYSVLLSLFSGFWAGFTGVSDSSKGFVSETHMMTGWLFSSLSFVFFCVTLVAGVACIARNTAANDAPSTPKTDAATPTSTHSAPRRQSTPAAEPAWVNRGENA